MNNYLQLIASFFIIEYGICETIDPLAYYDFENEEANIVRDKGPSGNDGIKDNEITYGAGPGVSNSSYPANESPAQGIDGNIETKYLNFARLNTGIIVSPQDSSVIKSISLSTANDAVDRDPTSFIIFGTNEAINSMDNGNGAHESWTEIESGSFGLPNSRNTPGTILNLENNIEYESYKIIFPTVKGNGNSMQIAEIQFYTEENADGDEILSPSDFVIGIHAAPDVPAFKGAPLGGSPDTAASFNNNKIDVPDINLDNVINGDGSYTFAAWIKPTELNGEKFIFGQTNQGIHNGIRNNAYLHQAHWGADTNGSTNLNELGLLPQSSASNYPANESPNEAIDGNINTKYLNFARMNAGIIITPQSPSIVASISFATANDAIERDPTSFVLYGTTEQIKSNNNSSGDRETWNIITSGDLNLPDERNTNRTIVNIDNKTEYTSYRLIFPTVKGNGNSMQIAEIQFYGERDGEGDNILSAGDPIIAIHAVGPNAEKNGDGWIHAAWTYDGPTDNAKIYLNGKIDWQGSKRAPNGSGNLIIGGRNGGERGFVGLIDEVVVWDVEISEEKIAQIAEGSSPIRNIIPFQITEITYSKENREFELTWDSKAGKTYSLFYNINLDEWESDIDDSIDSGGETTTYRFENPEGTEIKRIFFKVIEN